MTELQMFKAVEEIKEEVLRLDLGINAEGLTQHDLVEKTNRVLYSGGYKYGWLFACFYSETDALGGVSNGVFLDALDNVLEVLGDEVLSDVTKR